MALRDLKSNIGASESIRPAAHTATVTGETVDTRGYDSAMALVAVGAVSGTDDSPSNPAVFVVKLQESDTTMDGDFTDVASTDLQGTFSTSLVQNTVERVGYIGSKRYVRAVITKTSGTSAAASAVIVLGDAHIKPVA